MADDDPFADPQDADRTVIRPRPGGARPAAVVTGGGPAGDGERTLVPRAAPQPRPRLARRGDAGVRRRGADRADRGEQGHPGGDAPVRARGPAEEPCRASRRAAAARARHRRDPRLRAQRPGHGRLGRRDPGRPLRALRHHRRPRPEHALGQPERVDQAVDGLDLLQRDLGRRALLRHPRPPDEGSGADARHPRAVLCLPGAGLRGPLPDRSARARPAVGDQGFPLQRDPAAAGPSRARPVAALGRRRPDRAAAVAPGPALGRRRRGRRDPAGRLLRLSMASGRGAAAGDDGGGPGAAGRPGGDRAAGAGRAAAATTACPRSSRRPRAAVSSASSSRRSARAWSRSSRTSRPPASGSTATACSPRPATR